MQLSPAPQLASNELVTGLCMERFGRSEILHAYESSSLANQSVPAAHLHAFKSVSHAPPQLGSLLLHLFALPCPVMPAHTRSQSTAGITQNSIVRHISNRLVITVLFR